MRNIVLSHMVSNRSEIYTVYFFVPFRDRLNMLQDLHSTLSFISFIPVQDKFKTVNNIH